MRILNVFSYLKLRYLLVILFVIFISGCGRGHPSHDSAPDPTPAKEVTLERIAITATQPITQGVSERTLAADNKQAFEAVDHYFDDSSQALTDLSVSDWHTNDKKVGYFDAPGVLTGGSPSNGSC